MKTTKQLLGITAIMLMCLACKSQKNMVTYTIASNTTIGYGVVPQTCLLVKEGDTEGCSLFYSTIEGFNYEPGLEYNVKVEKTAIENPPVDGSSIRYKLIKVISKEKKQSENLPEIRNAEPFEMSLELN